jgi:hypothetical protein
MKTEAEVIAEIVKAHETREFGLVETNACTAQHRDGRILWTLWRHRFASPSIRCSELSFDAEKGWSHVTKNERQGFEHYTVPLDWFRASWEVRDKEWRRECLTHAEHELAMKYGPNVTKEQP